jgi:hypothetical protein
MRRFLKPHTRLFLRREDGEHASHPFTSPPRNALSNHPPRRFLLHYTARDAIDVLATGTKGLVEMREAAETHYNDESGSIPTPLFGMAQFRRRKVLIKLVLEGTSRLIQGSHLDSLAHANKH